MKPAVYKLGILFILLVLAVGGCRKAGTWLVKTDEPAHADAIIMLMGSIADRVLQVADLYEENLAEEVWIVEESMGAFKALEDRGAVIISNSTQAGRALVELGVPADRLVIIPGSATSTQMEAEIVRDYLSTRSGIESVLIVSSATHTRRASMIFRAAFKSADEQVSVFCSPSPYSNFNARRWWRNREDIQDVLFEYLKIANFVLFERRQLRE